MCCAAMPDQNLHGCVLMAPSPVAPGMFTGNVDLCRKRTSKPVQRPSHITDHRPEATCHRPVLSARAGCTWRSMHWIHRYGGAGVCTMPDHVSICACSSSCRMPWCDVR